MGDTAEECARQLTEAGVVVVGANCGDLDPLAMADVISLLARATELPILAEANAGMPKLENNRAVFDLNPRAFAEGMMECIKNGATLVGGCCGTTADHIHVLASEINRLKPEGV
jgi:5-methyltetrahydrofolate--homocysteine methyltransferase